MQYPVKFIPSNNGVLYAGGVVLIGTDGEPYGSGAGLDANAATPLPPAIVSVLTSSTAVIGPNPNRRGLVLQNIGPNPITIDPSGEAAALGVGIVLNPQPSAGLAGGSIIFDNALVPITAITAVTTGGTTSLLVVEFV